MMQNKPRNLAETKTHSSLKTSVGEGVAVEDVMVVEVIKTTTSKKDNQANKIGVTEDVVKEVVEQTTQTLNVTNATNRGTMRRNVIPTVAITVENGTSCKILSS